MEFTSGSECPDSYLYWTALATLSAAVQRRIHIKWLYYTFYPNIYVILVGPPGRVHKSSAIKFGRKLLTDCDIAVAADAATKEAIIREMKEHGSGGANALGIFSSEFGSFIAPSGPRMVEFLTDIYDCPDDWQYKTKTQGKDKLPAPYLSLLAGTTPAWIAEEFTSAFIETGFAARTIFVSEKDPRFRRAFADITPEMHDMRDRLVRDLDGIAGLEGEMVWTGDAREWFRSWYEDGEFDKESIDYRLEGYLNRKPTHIVRLSMLLSLAESSGLVLDRRHMEQAKFLLDGIEPTMAQAFASVGRNPVASAQERIAADIKKAGEMTYADLLKDNTHELSKQELDEVLTVLTMTGQVQRDHGRPGGLVYVARS